MRPIILIVDDFENTRFVVKHTLKSSGYDILEAENGKVALSFFDGRKIDLVVTDYNMPVMNGVDLVKEIRKIAYYQNIPILMLTTETNQKKKDIAVDAQITGWIQKPYKMDKFLKIIEKCLNQ